MIDEMKKRPAAAASSILQLGRQHIFLKPDDVPRLADVHQFELSTGFPRSNVRKPLLGEQYIDDGSFFSQLGFANVDSVDFSSDEDPTYAHDWNLPIERSIRNKYDFVYDGGTLEHIFDIKTSFENVFKALKVGGRIVHSSPSNNHVDHGFYMFSPTLFYDYYAVNNFLIHEFKIFTYTSNHNTDPWEIYDYTPGCIDHLSMGGFNDGRLLGIFVSAEKTNYSTSDKIPQQGMYVGRWSDYESDTNVQSQRKFNDPLNETPDIFGKIMRKVRGVPKPPKIPNKVARY